MGWNPWSCNQLKRKNLLGFIEIVQSYSKNLYFVVAKPCFTGTALNDRHLYIFHILLFRLFYLLLWFWSSYTCLHVSSCFLLCTWGLFERKTITTKKDYPNHLIPITCFFLKILNMQPIQEVWTPCEPIISFKLLIWKVDMYSSM